MDGRTLAYDGHGIRTTAIFFTRRLAMNSSFDLLLLLCSNSNDRVLYSLDIINVYICYEKERKSPKHRF